MKYPITIALLLSFQLAFSQSYTSSISQFTIKDGLSSDKIYALHKGAQGFIWVGTEEGLNRFDGKEFKVYSPDTEADMTITAIHEIYEDDAGYLWLLKKNERYEEGYRSPIINLFNIYTGEITTAKERFGDAMPFEIADVHFMKSLADGQLYFYCNLLKQGFIYNAAVGFKSFKIPEEIVKLDDVILQEDGHFLMKVFKNHPAPEWEIIKADKEGNVLARRNPELLIPLKGNGNSINAKFDGENHFVKGYNLEAYDHFSPDLSFEEYAPKDVEHINQSSWNKDQQLLWIMNRDRIRAIRPDGTIVFQQNGNLDDKDSPILFDGNTTWISNKRDGLTAIQLQANHFTNYRFFEKDLDNSTRGIYQEKSGKVWVSTINGSAQIFPDGQVSSEEQVNNVYTRFMEDAKGNLLYFNGKGLIKYHFDTQQETLYPMEGGYACWSLLEIDSNELWFSGHNGVIFKINKGSDRIRSKAVLPSDLNHGFHVYEYLQKENASYWLCTNQGLYEVDIAGTTLNIYNKEQEGKNYLPATSFHHIYQDPDGVIWLATGDAGLLKLKMENGEITLEKQYTVEQGLSCNSIHAIYEDDYDYLWISSDNGLMQFDKKTEQVYQYFVEDGIPHNEFNRIAHCSGRDGQLFFGGLIGVTTFHPKDFAAARNQKNDHPLVISSFQQYSGKKEKFEDLTTNLLQTQTISLAPSDPFFHLEVALLNYALDNKNSYQYRIKDHSDWQSNDDGKLKISGLPYGNHKLEIRAFSSSQQEAANNLILDVHVLKPMYMQWWFIASLLSITTLGGWFLAKKRTQKLIINLVQDETEIQQETEKVEQEIIPEKLMPVEAKIAEKVPKKEEEIIFQEDIDWFQQVELIAKREIKTQNFNVDNLAQELFISRRQLYRRIKKMTGLTPKKYLKSVRLQKAKLILETEDVLTLTEVCYAVGFENTTHFANLFETEFGQRPHELLKRSVGV